MKYDQKNALKLQISVYLEESLGLVGKMMLEDIFYDIDSMDESEAAALVEHHYDNNIFELIAPYLEFAIEEYDAYKKTPEGIEAMNQLKKTIEEFKQSAIDFGKIKVIKNDEGNGNVH